MAAAQAPPLPTIFGREREVTLGARLIDDALAGRGALLLISGEAGIGKTALAQAISAAAAARGAAVRIGRCYDLTETPPYGPWVELFAPFPAGEGARPLPAIVARRAAPHGASSQAALFADVREYLAAVAVETPLVLLLDDLHWADAASLDLLHVLARQLAPLPILLIATYRDDELLPGHPLAHLLPALVRESAAARLDLRRLDADAIGALVAARYPLGAADAARLVRYLRDRTDGNPLFVGEMLRTLEEEAVLARGAPDWTLGELGGVRVPALLRHVIDRRIARLDDAARVLLALAALIGQDVPLDLWGGVAGADDRALLPVVERAIAARLLEAAGAGGEGVRFTHALIRQALYEATAPPRRRIWHRQVAESLAAGRAPDPDAVGYHFRQAGDARAAEWLIRAGERARHAHAWLTAADRFESAATIMERNGEDPSARARLLIALAWLRRYVAPQAGIVALDQAAQLAEEAGDRALEAEVLNYRGFLRCFAGDIGHGLKEMVAGVAAREALGSDMRSIAPEINDARGTLMLWLAHVGRYPEVRMRDEDLVRQLPESGDGKTGAASHPDRSYGMALVHAALGEPHEARQAFAATRDAYRTMKHFISAGMVAIEELNRVVLPYQADQVAERQVLTMEAEDALRRASGAWEDISPRLAHLPSGLLEGAWGEARQLARSIYALKGMARWRFYATSVLAQLARNQGDADQAWAFINEGLPAGPATEPGGTVFLDTLVLQRLAAMLALDTGDLSLMRSWLEAHDRWIAWSGSVVGRAEGMIAWATYHRAAGEHILAYEIAASALARATEPRHPLAILAAHRLLGELDYDASRVAEAAAHLETAVALAERCAAPYERAASLVALAMTQEGRAAEATLLAAQEIARALGARPLLWQTHLSLGHHYHGRNRYADAERAYLAAQRMIAELAANRADGDARRRFLDASTGSIPPVYRLRGRKAAPGSLTAREHEVVAQVAQGKSNREIAEALFIAEKTVEMHVSNSLGKLGFRSRAQLAAWSVASDNA